jgi:DNA-binding response OmpR family regulator
MAATVLIVDDDRTLIEVLNMALTRAGFETRTAYDGTQALRILNAERVDIVVLDVMLPDFDGFEVCRRVRAIPRMSELPILMLSARSQVTDRLSGFEAGADDYVAKPVVIKELIARIWTLINRAQRARGVATPVIAFVGAKGGVGTTTTALNVALSLRDNNRTGILFELNSTGTTAPWLLAMPTTQNLFSLSSSDTFRISLPALQSCISTHSASGLHYMPGHGHEIGPAGYRAGVLADTINLLQLSYNYVFMDLSVSALSACGEALIHSSLILPVTEYDSAAIWHLEALMGWLKANKLMSKVPGFVMVDRSPGPIKDPPTAIASQVGLDILAVIPSAIDALYYANSRQEPLYLADPTHPASVAMAELGRRITTLPVRAPASLEA